MGYDPNHEPKQDLGGEVFPSLIIIHWTYVFANCHEANSTGVATQKSDLGIA